MFVFTRFIQGGGVYLDTDIEVFQSFEPFLNHRMFISREAIRYGFPRQFGLTAHVFGAEKGHPFLRECMRYYERRHFDWFEDETTPESQRFTCPTSPIIMKDIAIHLYGYNQDSFLDKKQVLEEDIHVYPGYYFDGPLFRNDPEHLYSIHRVQSSWRPDRLPDDKPINYMDRRGEREPLSSKIYRILNKITIKLFGRVLIIKFFKVHESER